VALCLYPSDLVFDLNDLDSSISELDPTLVTSVKPIRNVQVQVQLDWYQITRGTKQLLWLGDRRRCWVQDVCITTYGSWFLGTEFMCLNLALHASICGR